jgi:hypothetical protein
VVVEGLCSTFRSYLGYVRPHFFFSKLRNKGAAVGRPFLTACVICPGVCVHISDSLGFIYMSYVQGFIFYISLFRFFP